MQRAARIQVRFKELEDAIKSVQIVTSPGRFGEGQKHVESSSWQKWSTSVLSLLKTVFGTDSPHLRNFMKVYDQTKPYTPLNVFHAAQGVFHAAKEDYEGGYVFSLETAISGEVFGDFIALAKQSLADGYKDVAAVLACAALEDTLKRYALTQHLSVGNKDMKKVVDALKSKGLVSGAQKTLLDTMPKIRDYAMHANWGKITAEDVGSVIGFVEQFLISHF